VASNNPSRSPEHSSELNEAFEVQSDGTTLRLVGHFRMHNAAAIWRELHEEINSKSGYVTVDLSKVQEIDGGVMALLVQIRAELDTRGSKVEFANANEQIESIVTLYSGHQGVVRHTKRRPEGLVAQIGRAAFEVYKEAESLLDFFGNMVITLVKLARHPHSGHWKDIAPLCEKTGANAVPIVLLINFLVGFVMAFQSAKQLKVFGANIYVADLVGISLTRELAPLMTAIIVCGRSGAAFAAELGSMKVNEEIDALRTLGLSPFGWLVIPRVLALLLVVPLLTLMADLVGITGGLLVGILDLGLTPQGYFIETLKSVLGWDVLTGLIKSLVFAASIALIACQQGFAASGGAEGVGQRTTSSVVSTLFALVIIDAIFTVIFRSLNI
jgi:phospholipid/cholesterol/gamma-HCH transport system permease protein